MTVAWMLYVLFAGSLLALGASALDGILRRTTLPTRWVWVVALGGIVALAVLAPRSPAPDQGRVAHASLGFTNTLTAERSLSGELGARFAAARAAVRGTMNGALLAVSARVPSSVATPLIVSWVLVSGALLVVIMIVNYRASADRHRWPMAELHGTQVRIAPEIGPAVIGLTHPEIVVPQWLLGKSSDEQRLVMVHEQEHIAARDQYLPVGALLVATLIPWHPAVWWSLARLRLAMELDCDARVLRRGVQAESYGTLLIDIAAQCGGHRVGALALADRTSHLERRIRAMTHRTSRFTAARTIGLASVAALAIVTACEARIPTSSEIAKMDVSAAERAATTVMLPAPGLTTTYDYVVDDKPMTAAEAHALPGSSIASMSMVKPKGAEAGAKGLVTIHTKEYEADHPETSLRSREVQGEVHHSATDMYIPYGKDAPLVVVDGVIAEQGVLAKLRSTDVASVEVLKGAAAKAAWSHPAAANGVITITTKHPKP